MIKVIKKIKSVTVVILAAVIAFSVPLLMQTANSQSAAAEELLRGSSGSYTVTEVVEYSRKEVYDYSMPYGLPGYIGASYANACAPVAGANILAYYAKMQFPQLVDHDLGFYLSNGRWFWTWNDGGLANTLYYMMKTNLYGGTTPTNFKNGLAQYINGKGLNVAYEYVMSGSNLNFGAYQARIYEGKPVLVGMTQFNHVSILNTGQNEQTVISSYITAGHAVVAYGYKEVIYYKFYNIPITPFFYVTVEMPFRVDRYLRVAFCSSTLWSLGLLRFEDNVVYTNIFAVNIF